MTANANVLLLNSSGQVLQSSVNTRRTAESIQATLDGGDYYIRVYPATRRASTNYTLGVSAVPTGYQSYTFKYTYGNGDYYTGSGYSSYRRYSQNQYINDSSVNETGNYGSYQITGVTNYNGSTSQLNQVFVSSYYNTENSTNYTPYSGYGTTGLGSEYGYLFSGNSDTYFGGKYYEADFNGYQSYTFKYTYGNGDYYTGSGYTNYGRYSQNQYINDSSANETGNYGSYQITGVTNYASSTSQLNQVFVSSYYNTENSTNYTPYSGYGTSGLGSESGYLISGNNDTYFGGKYHEADIITGDWFDQNIQDAGLRVATRSRFTDGSLNRNDLIAIFKDSEDGSVVDATEITDLRKLVSNATYLAMSDDVRVLSNKIANGDVANASYQGTSLGNLYAGSSATQMENLISKWFLGSDRPIASDGATTYTYRLASGSLFQNGISYQDVSQGAVGDCYLLAGLAATAFRSSSTIQNMFIDNGDNTYTVRFFKSDGTKDYVTVDKYLPTLPDINSNYVSGGNLPFAKIGGRHDNYNTELWVALAEKAYAQLNESGWIGQDNTNSYQGIAGGSSVYTFEQISGRDTSFGSPDFTLMVNAYNASQLVAVSSKGDGQVAANIVSNHQYVLTNYNSSTQKFTLFNPWGINGATDPSNGQYKPGSVELSWSEITASFDEWEYTTT
ncbi:hypothetical protein H6F74_13285 [Trichocoleus sp. FACHB-90]|nr:hypothetical protein [Trichocoleus sp. FACHB-90]